MKMQRLGFGGSCHWCTEAIFHSLKGVQKVEQGWIASSEPNDTFSEAVIVHFDEERIGIDILVAIHLYTHSCTSSHSMRKKYRSAVYVFDGQQEEPVETAIHQLQSEFEQKIITEILPFVAFKGNEERYLNYYQKNRENQFCQSYINPKLKRLMQRFSNYYQAL